MRVLIADDEKIIADSLAAIFRTRGIQARAVYNGEDAMALAEVFAPNVLICDVVMEGANGFDVGIYFRQHLPECRVLLFSGHLATTNALLSSDASHHGFDLFTKPVHPKVLLDYVMQFAGPEEPSAAPRS